MKENQSNRDNVLDAAETLFAEKGYDATTVREVSRAADVALGLMSYYFPTKSDLYVAVVQRRDAQHVADVVASISEAKAKAGGRPLPIRELIRAYWLPIIAKCQRNPGWRNYIQVLTRHTSVPTGSDSFALDVAETYKVLPQMLIDTLRDNYPDAPDEKIYWAYYILSSAMIHMLLENDRIDYVSGGVCKSSDLETIVESVATIFDAGFKGYLSGPVREHG